MKNIRKYFRVIFLLLCLFGLLNKGNAQNRDNYNIKIKVKYALAQPGDTLTLSFGPQSIESRIKSIFHRIVDKNGVCTFNVETEFEYGYISIRKIKQNPKWRTDSKGLVNSIFWESGDDILINIPDNIKINDYRTNTTFYGKGSGKYKILYEIKEEQENYYDDVQNYISNGNNNSFLNPLSDTITISCEKKHRLLDILERNKNNLSSLAYDVIKTDIMLADPCQASEIIGEYYYTNIKIAPESIQDIYKKRIYKLFLPYQKLDVSDKGMAASYAFQKMNSNIFYVLSILEDRSSNLSALFQNIGDIANGVKRESIILATLNKLGMKANQEGIDILEKTIEDPRYKLMLSKQLEFVGKNILGYSFIDTLGNTIEFSKFKGKLLLVDFWYSGCTGCAKLYQTILSKIEEEYRDHPNFVVVSISIDTKMEKWLSSIKKNQYTNEDCINLSTGSIGMNHPFISDLGIFKYPYVILVDKNGNIIMTDTVELRDSVDSLSKVIRQHI